MRMFLECEVCHKMFEPMTPDALIHQKYCSQTCKNKAKRMRMIKSKKLTCNDCYYFDGEHCHVMNVSMEGASFACLRIRTRKFKNV